VKKRVMSSAAVGESIIAWTRADISAIGCGVRCSASASLDDR